MSRHRLALGLGALILTQGPSKAWGADDYEDIDLLKEPKKKTHRPEIVRKPVQEIDETTETAETAEPLVRLPSGAIGASLSVPPFDPRIHVELSVGQQRFTVEPGSMSVPAGQIDVHATLTHANGESRTVDYSLDVPTAGTRLTLPHTLEIQVGGKTQQWWFLSPTGPDLPESVAINVPGSSMRTNFDDSLSGQTSGLLLAEGEIVEVRIPTDARPFAAYRQWRSASSRATPTFALAGLGVAAGAGLIVTGIVQRSHATKAKREAEAIDDPEDGANFQHLENTHTTKQTLGGVLIGMGVGMAAAGITLTIVPGQKQSAEVSRTKNALLAEQPIMLHDYLVPTASHPMARDQPPPTDPPTPPPTGETDVWD